MTLPLLANWQAPNNVFACSTFRHSNSEAAGFDKNNPLHRKNLLHNLSLPADPEWLMQTHSNTCVTVETTSNRHADAAITRSPNHVLAVLTADCLPIVLTNSSGSEIAVIHAGWRGLSNGILENTLSQMASKAADLIAWIGPAICSNCFEVGVDVFEAYQENYSFASNFFQPLNKEKWLANLPGLAQQILNHLLVCNIYQSKACTFEQTDLYYSYRREGQTGRIATIVWFT